MSDDFNINTHVDSDDMTPNIEAIINAAGLLQLIPIYGRSMSGKEELVFANVDSIKKSLNDYDERIQNTLSSELNDVDNMKSIFDSLFTLLNVQKEDNDNISYPNTSSTDAVVGCTIDNDKSEINNDVINDNEINDMDDIENLFNSIDQQFSSIDTSSITNSTNYIFKNLSDQQKNESNNIFKCNKCDKIFHARRNLYFHERQVHDVQKTICPDCGRPLRNHATLIRHRRTHYGPLELKFICPTCGKRCRERRHLIIHCSNLGHPVPPDTIPTEENPFMSNDLLESEQQQPQELTPESL